jgi:hypothetical protein
MLINRPNGQDQFSTWQVKVGGVFELPVGFRVSPLLRYQSGNNFGRTFVATLNSGSVTLLAEPFNSERMPNVAVADVRVEKGIVLAKRRLGLYFDVYNIFNTNAETNLTISSGDSWLRPLGITPPRIARIGARFDW